MAPQTAATLQTEDSKPEAKPERITVAEPVFADLAHSVTGFFSMAVKCSVIFSRIDIEF